MSEPQLPKVKVKRLAHIALWTIDVVAQTRFYRQVMGFDLRATKPSFELEDTNVYLSLNDERPCLALFSDTRLGKNHTGTPSHATRLHHIAFEVQTNAELAAIALRLKQSGTELTLGDGDNDLGMVNTLWFSDPDNNRIEISITPEDTLTPSSHNTAGPHMHLRPQALQHLALQTSHLEPMVEFYTEVLGFDVSDWLLRECAWLRCDTDHHTIMLIKGKQGINHIGYSVFAATDICTWADSLSRERRPVLWGPGRHGAGNDLFLRFADAEDIHIELSAELQQYYDREATTPQRLWHSRSAALNLWGVMPSWVREEAKV